MKLTGSDTNDNLLFNDKPNISVDNVMVLLTNSYLKTVVFKTTVDTIDYSFINAINYSYNKDINVIFEGPNYFTYTGDDAVIDKRTITSGNYYLDNNGVLYLLNSDNTASVVYAPLNLNVEAFTVPKTILSENGENEYKVTTIGKNAFRGCSNITSVTLSENITEICDNAFADCSSLVSVNISENISKLGYTAFANCTKLASVSKSFNNGTVKDFVTLDDILDEFLYAKASPGVFYNTLLLHFKGWNRFSSRQAHYGCKWHF